MGNQLCPEQSVHEEEVYVAGFDDDFKALLKELIQSTEVVEYIIEQRAGGSKYFYYQQVQDNRILRVRRSITCYFKSC